MGANDKREATFHDGGASVKPPRRAAEEPMADWIARQPYAVPGKLMPHRLRYFTAADFNALRVALLNPRLELATTRELLKELQMRADLFTVVEPDTERGRSAIGMQEATTAWLQNLPSSLLDYRNMEPELEPEEDLARPDWGTGHQPPEPEPEPETGPTAEEQLKAVKKALEHAERAEAAYESARLEPSGWSQSTELRINREVALSRMWSALL